MELLQEENSLLYYKGCNNRQKYTSLQIWIELALGYEIDIIS